MSDKFMIETETVSSVAQSLSSMINELSSLSESVSGYDVTCEDGFNFEGPKGIIASNIASCSTKISNTMNALNTVQSSMHFEGVSDSASAANSSDNGSKTSKNYSSGTNRKASTSTRTPSGSSSGGGGGGYTGGGGGGGYSGGGSSGGGSTPSYAAVTPAVASGTLKSTDKNKVDTGSDSVISKVKVDSDKTELTNVQKRDSEPANIKSVGYAYAISDKMSADSSKLIKEKVTYDSDGYAKIGDRYVVSCDSSVGKVGDVLRFTNEDGTVTEFVVGVNTESSKYKNRINFLVDKNSSSNLHANEISKNILANNKSIENYGNINEYGKKVTTISGTVGNTQSSTSTNNTQATATSGTSTDNTQATATSGISTNNSQTTVSGSLNSDQTSKTVDTSSITDNNIANSLDNNDITVTENMQNIMDNVDNNNGVEVKVEEGEING